LSGDLILLDTYDLKFKVKAVWQRTELHLSLNAVACTVDNCLPELPVVSQIKFAGAARRRRRDTSE
jgi:hypothetical protein